MPPSKSFVAAASVAPLPLSKHQSPSQYRKRARSPPLEENAQNERTTQTDSGESEDDDDGSDATTSKVAAAKTVTSSSSSTTATSEPPLKKPTKPRRRNTISATIEIRALRVYVQQLEETLESLVGKWQTRIPERGLWPMAYEAAKQKWQTAQVEARHKLLSEQLTAQQLHMSTLQSLLPQSPLFAYPSSTDIFGAMHFRLHLRDVSDAERIEQLAVRDDSALRLAPALVDKFTAKHIASVSCAVPFARSNISADASYTYLSSIFIARIPRVSVQRVVDAVLHYCETVYSEMEHRFDVKHELQPIHTPSKLRKYNQIKYTSPTSFTSHSCTSFAATVSDDSGVIVMDFVDRDDRFPEMTTSEHVPERARRQLSFMVHVTPTTDPVTGEPQVLLRQVRVNRYNLGPDDELLREEVRLTQLWSNGDLFVALVCQYLMDSQ